MRETRPVAHLHIKGGNAPGRTRHPPPQKRHPTFQIQTTWLNNLNAPLVPGLTRNLQTNASAKKAREPETVNRIWTWRPRPRSRMNVVSTVDWHQPYRT